VGVYHLHHFPLCAPVRAIASFLLACDWQYTSFMAVILFGMRLLEVLFFVGIAGSAVVVVIATAEDVRELATKTKHGHAAEKTPQS
jgi:hypothetical protein